MRLLISRNIDCAPWTRRTRPWQMLWPSPEVATVTLYPESASLSLPQLLASGDSLDVSPPVAPLYPTPGRVVLRPPSNWQRASTRPEASPRSSHRRRAALSQRGSSRPRPSVPSAEWRAHGVLDETARDRDVPALAANADAALVGVELCRDAEGSCTGCQHRPCNGPHRPVAP